MRNYGWVDLFEGHYLVARNGGCTFKVYDLQQKMCVKTYQVLGRRGNAGISIFHMTGRQE